MNQQYNYFQTGSGVYLYVVDSGIDRLHPDFGGRVATNTWFTSQGDPFYDCWGHGTMVASAAGATQKGVAKGVTIVSEKVGDCTGHASDSDIAAAVDFAADNQAYGFGPAVVNISMGKQGTSNVMESAIRDAVADGVTVVVAAGNDGIDACGFTPAREPQAITVAAIRSDTDARFVDPTWWTSDYGSCVDLFAPGLFIDVDSVNNTTTQASGTSLAAPQVAGTAALVIASTGISVPAWVGTRIGNSATVGAVSNAGTGSPNLLLYSLFTSTEIQGLHEVSQDGSYTWTAATYGGNGAFTYQWQMRYDGAATWNNLVGETGSSVTLAVAAGEDDFSLRILATSFGDQVSHTLHVDNLICTVHPEHEDCNY
jgi:subtilisin family serine protease